MRLRRSVALCIALTLLAGGGDALGARRNRPLFAPIILFPDLAITNSASPNPVTVGSALIYTLTVTNNGPANATGVILSDALPASTTFVSATPSQGSCTGTSALSCALGALDAGASATVIVVVTPTTPGAFSNTAAVRGNEDDPNTTNNTATAVTTVLAGISSAALSVPSISTTSSTAQLLGDIRIEENTAGDLGTGGRIVVRLPSCMTFASTPIVAPIVSNGLQIDFTAGNAPRLDPPIEGSGGSQQFSFAILMPSSRGPAILRISGISVLVQSCLRPGPVFVSVGAPSLEIPSMVVQDATAVAPGGPPALAALSPGGAARGASNKTVGLTGFNFTPSTTASLGGDIAVTGVIFNSATQLTVAFNVSPSATPGLRDVSITAGGTSSTLMNAFRVAAPPTVVSTDRAGTNALVLNSSQQKVNITGTRFEDRTGDLQRGSALPGDLVVFGGSGITVETVTYVSDTQVQAEVNAGSGATGPQAVTVCNSFGACGTGGIVDVTDGGLPAPKNSSSGGTVPAAPFINGFSPSARGLLGSRVDIQGMNFGATITANAAFFAGPAAVRVPATITAASSTLLTVNVPSTAVDGPVTVAVGAQLSNAVDFTITNPRLSTLSPSSAAKPAAGTTTVPIVLSGSKFATSAAPTVAFNLPPNAPPGAVNGISVLASPTVSPTGAQITMTIGIGATAQSGLRDVTVTNPDGAFSTLPAAFEVKNPTRLELSLVEFATVSDYLPTVGPVTVMTDASGGCTSKMVTPVPVTLQATFMSNAGAPPPASGGVTFTIISSTSLQGTSINEDCPLGAVKDFSFSGDFTQADAVQQITVPNPSPSGVWTTTFYSYDWGGSATVQAVLVADPTVKGGITLPVDSDRDGAPDRCEKNDPALNPNDRGDPVTRDGLSNAAKCRGVILRGPAPGQTLTIMPADHIALSAGKRHLFVRGVGFANDPQRPTGKCGVNPDVTPPAWGSDPSPCPPLELGTAFQLPSLGVEAHDVTAFFTASTVFPTQSMAPRASPTDPILPTLDLATVFYDGFSCFGGEVCNPARTGKVGVRQWQFSTLGFSTFGTASAFGTARVFAQAVNSYVGDTPYVHRTNDPMRVVTAPDGTPMLAPIGVVADGNDNGVRDGGERVDPSTGLLLGDTYIPGSFSFALPVVGLSAMDVNNDGCVELPFVSDPTTIATRCSRDPSDLVLGPLAPSATSPQATKRQVVRSLVTHELFHAIGVSLHTADPTDIMYQYSTDWVRDGSVSGTAAGLVQTHNKGVQ